MEIPEILEELSRYTGKLPREAIREAVARQEEITPELIRVIDEARETLARGETLEESTALTFALYLLAQFRETRAYPAIAELLSIPSDAIADTLEEVLTEDMGRILASVSGGDTSHIERLIENPNVNEYVRSAGLKALVTLVMTGMKERDEVISYFRSLFHGRLEREGGFVWAKLVVVSTDLWPGELMDEIRQAYEEALVERFVISLKEVERQLSQGKEAALELTRRIGNYTLIDDTEAELGSWYCYNEAPPPKPPVAAWKPPSPAQAPATPGMPVRKGRKIGRNEPCPCGSSKKYKRCCGA